MQIVLELQVESTGHKETGILTAELTKLAKAQGTGVKLARDGFVFLQRINRFRGRFKYQPMGVLFCFALS